MWFYKSLQQPSIARLAKTRADIAKKRALFPTRLFGYDNVKQKGTLASMDMEFAI